MNKPHPYSTTLIEHCLQRFQSLTGIDWSLSDARQVTLRFPQGELDYIIEVKAKIDRFSALDALKSTANRHDKTLIVTPYLSPDMVERCRELNMQCMDSAGNSYLNNHAGAYVLITGQRPSARMALQGEPAAMTPSGLRIVFALFAQPNLLNATYRDIAAAAGVSLGVVGTVLGQLTERGFLGVNGAGKRAFLHRRRLVVEWAGNYLNQLRPRLARRRFALPDPEQLRTMGNPAQEGMVWSGEGAAAEWTKHLRPQSYTLYADMQSPYLAKIAATLRMRPDPQGELEIVEPFWNPAVLKIDGLAPPELIYADLLAIPDSRSHETADIVLDRLIGHE